MANTSKILKWQVSFGVTHQLEYQEVIEFFERIPKRQQGAIGRKLILAGLRALKDGNDPVVSSILGSSPNIDEDTTTSNPPQNNNKKKINNKMMGLLDG